MSEEITSPEVEVKDAPVSEEAGNPEPLEDDQLEKEEGEEKPEADEDGEEKPEEVKEEDGKKKLSANERIQQLVEERNKDREELTGQLTEAQQKIADLEKRFIQTQEPAPFIDVDYDKINAHIAETSAAIEELKASGNALEARKLEKYLDNLVSDVEDNDQKRKEFEAQSTANQTERQALNKRIDTLGQAADFYRDQMKIPAPTWDLMGKLFADACAKDPILGREFAERADTQSPVATVRWAHEYTKTHLVKDTASAAQKKNEAKEKSASVSGTGGADSSSLKTYDDLMKLPAKERDALYKNNRKLFDKLVDSV